MAGGYNGAPGRLSIANSPLPTVHYQQSITACPLLTAPRLMNNTRNLARRAFPYVYRLLIRLIAMTCRVTVQGQSGLDTQRANGQPWVYVAWHNNVAMLSWYLRNQNVACLVSNSKDGELIARSVAPWDFLSVRGSSSAGGAKALIAMIRAVKAGKTGLVTPDGPRGPVFQCQPGAVMIGQKTARPLVPVHLEADRLWVFSRSWDLHKVPKPFSRVVIRYGEPVWIPADLDRDGQAAAVATLQQAMRENMNQARQRAGLPPYGF